PTTDGISEASIDFEKLMHREAAAIARMVAIRTAGAAHEAPIRPCPACLEPRDLVIVQLCRLGAVLADLANKTLGDDAVHGGRNHVALSADIEEPMHGSNGAHGVERGEDEVPGDRRAQTDIDGLPIAHFADQDDVGVLA